MIRTSIKKKLIALVLIAMVPLLALAVYLLYSLTQYSRAYDEIVSNMTIANSYNLNFREEMDETIYKLVVQGLPFDKPEAAEAATVGEGDDKKAGEGEEGAEVRSASEGNPYELIEELRTDFRMLVSITTDRESRTWLNNLLRNIDTLQERVDDIRENIIAGGRYQENLDMVEKNIYILTELIQDDIQYYIYYQTRSIDQLKDTLGRQIRTFRLWAGAALGVLTLLVFILTAVVVLSITGPLDELTEVTGRISKGDFNARAGVRSRDELSVVASSVNDMARHLEVMVDRVKDDERKMRYAELRLLQEQINPHFLYNALDTIIWLIEGGREEEAVDMVVSLSDFFRLVLSHGKEFITIRDEELHIRSYLQIQQVRYRDILTYDIEIDPILYNYKILKLTLQPLVENALYHGIKYKRAMGHVLITGRMTGNHTIMLTVEDDGVGMDKETLERLRREISLPCQETTAGFGMANVNERIRMNFGKAYGIRVDSEQGVGTKVTVTIPAEWIGETEQETVLSSSLG